MGKHVFFVFLLSVSFNVRSLAISDSVAIFTDLDLAHKVAKEKDKFVFSTVEYGKIVLNELELVPQQSLGRYDIDGVMVMDQVHLFNINKQI